MFMASGKSRGSSERPIRVLLAKPAIDGHDRGVYVLARAFRDAGMEVIYPGLLPTPEQIVEIAIDEDVDVIAISLLNGSHMTIFKKVMELLRARHAGDVAVIGGGIIPPRDRPRLERMGVTGNYGPGTPLETIITHVRERAAEVRRRRRVA